MTVAETGNNRASEVRGRHVLLVLLGFFAVIVVADATLIYKAVTTFGGLDNPNAYRDGLAYNRRIASAREQTTAGWRDSIEVTGHPVRLRVSLHDRKGDAVIGARLVADVGRAATDRFDTRLTLAEVEPGLYEAAFAGAEAGSWVVDVSAFRDRDGANRPLYQARRRIWIAP